MKNYFSVSAKMEEVFCERKNEANEKRKNFDHIRARASKPKTKKRMEAEYYILT